MAGFTEEWLRQRNRDVLGIAPDIAISISADGDIPQDLRPEWMMEAECTKLMEEDGWRALRTDPVSDRKRGTGFGEVSMADHLYMRPVNGYSCEVLWCEFKAGKNRATKAQIAWHAKERARGLQTWIANEDFPASVEGFRQHYAKSGLMRRPQWW